MDSCADRCVDEQRLEETRCQAVYTRRYRPLESRGNMTEVPDCGRQLQCVHLAGRICATDRRSVLRTAVNMSACLLTVVCVLGILYQDNDYSVLAVTYRSADV
jgi:hypothetical protein